MTAPDHHSPDITFTSVTKAYPGAAVPAVDGVTLHAPAGKLTVLLGQSGAGKTTLMKMANRLVEPDSGQVRIGGADARGYPAAKLRRGIGYVIQQVGLFPHMTVAQNIAVVPRLEGWSSAKIDRRIDELLELVNLPLAYRQRYPRQLSGGEQQRVGLARALAADPGILLMDEPFGALDAITRPNLREQLAAIQRQVSKTVLFVTHDVEEALKLGDWIAVLRGGRLVQVGAPLEILTRPADGFVAELLGSGSALRRLSLLTAGDALAKGNRAAPPPGSPGVAASTDLRAVLEVLLAHGAVPVAVRDAEGRQIGAITFEDVCGVL